MKPKAIAGLVAFLFISHAAVTQTSQFLVIGRNTGSYPTLDGNNVRIFGFTKALSAPVYIPAPTLDFNEGDSVVVDFWNVSQGAPHTIHLHGLDLDQQNDGVPHLSFEVGHMDHGYYRFRAPHAGTYLYHCHVTSPIHVQAGMYGLVIIRPPGGEMKTWTGGYAFDSEEAWLTSEIDTFWHKDAVLNHAHDTSNPSMRVPIPDYHPQYFLVNGITENQITDSTVSLTAAMNERVYLRLANVGFMANRYYFPPELNALVVSSDGRPLPQPEGSDTLWVFPGERFGVMLTPLTEFTSTVNVGFHDLNTLNLGSVQHIPVLVTGYFGLQQASINDLLVSPNPSTGAFNVSLPDRGYDLLQVYDVCGRCVHTVSLPREANQVRLELPGLPAGTYTIELRGKERAAGQVMLTGY